LSMAYALRNWPEAPRAGSKSAVFQIAEPRLVRLPARMAGLISWPDWPSYLGFRTGANDLGELA